MCNISKKEYQTNPQRGTFTKHLSKTPQNVKEIQGKEFRKSLTVKKKLRRPDSKENLVAWIVGTESVKVKEMRMKFEIQLQKKEYRI